jgi:hypothetical protein
MRRSAAATRTKATAAPATNPSTKLARLKCMSIIPAVFDAPAIVFGAVAGETPFRRRRQEFRDLLIKMDFSMFDKSPNGARAGCRLPIGLLENFYSFIHSLDDFERLHFPIPSAQLCALGGGWVRGRPPRVFYFFTSHRSRARHTLQSLTMRGKVHFDL